MKLHSAWSAAETRAFEAALRGLESEPYPLDRVFPGVAVYTQAELVELRALQEAIHGGLRALVEARPDTPDLRGRLSMEPEVERVLDALHGRPYAVGSVRPDVLYDREGVFRICELNARFPTNGYWITALLEHVAPLVANWVPARPLRREPPIPTWFLADETVVLKGREAGWDIHLLKRQHVAGQRCSIEPLEALEISPHRVSVGGRPLDRPGVRVCLELHQDELIALGSEALVALHDRVSYFNDLRTVFVAHDKRTLAVLGDADLMRPLVGEAQAGVLARHIIPTFVLGERPDVRAEARRDRGAWVLKPNRLGKAVGMLLGSDCTAEAWRAALDDPARSNHVLQPRVINRTFELSAADGRAEVVGTAGLLMGAGHLALGPGMVRASSRPVINVSGGGWMLLAMEASTP